MNFHMKGKGSVPFRAGKGEAEMELGGGWLDMAEGRPKPPLVIGTRGHLIPSNQQLQTDS